MSRYNHLLAAGRDDRQPSQWCVLDCEVTAAPHPTDPRREVESLVSWAVCGTSGQAGVYRSLQTWQGQDRESFWTALASRLARRGALWLVGDHLCRLLALVGFWEALEDGRVYLAGEDNHGRRGGSDRAVSGVRGTGIAELDQQRGRAKPRVHEVSEGVPHPDRGRKAERSGRRHAALGAAVLEDPPTVIRFRLPKRPGTCVAVDSRNYGVEAPGGPSSATDRAKRLAQWMLRALSTLSEEGLGAWRATAAAQGQAAWRRAHHTHLVVAHTGPRALSLEGDAYHGGRCEAFRLGAIPGPIWHLDVRSMYPWCALAGVLPAGLVGWQESPPDARARDLCARHLCIAEVTIASPEPAYPYRDSSRGLTVWPTGTFRCCLCGPELDDALRLGRVGRWHRIAWYSGAPFLQEWAAHMLALREAHRDDPDMTAWLKAVMVGGIGRLGARERYWEDAPCALLCHWWDAWGIPRADGGLERWRCLAGRTQRQVVGGYGPEAVPAAAAWITGMARLRLLRIIRCAGWRHTVYCDTDSVFVDRQGLARLSAYGWMDPARAGYLKEVAVHERLRIRGLKWYETETAAVQAGRGRDRVAADGQAHLSWTRIGPAGGLSAHRRPDAGRVAVPHARDPVYRHGVRGKCGRVTPIHIEEG